MRSIIKKPIVTEKGISRNDQGLYAFVVDVRANKIQIKDAIEALYGVNVEQVRTANYAGKRSIRYTKSRVLSGQKPAFKKAFVQLEEGEIIDIYDNE